MSSPFDDFRGPFGPDSGMREVIQLVKDLDNVTIPPLYDNVRSEVIHTRILPALQSQTVVTAEGSPIQVEVYEVPVSDSVKIPISDLFSGLITLLNKAVRDDSMWYGRGLAMMTKVFEVIKKSQWAGLKKKPPPFPTDVAADSRTTDVCMQPTHVVSPEQAADFAKLYAEKAPLGGMLFNCAEALLILGLGKDKQHQTVYAIALTVPKCWKEMPSNADYDLDAVVRLAHKRLCENCRYQAQVHGIQCLDPVANEVYDLYAASANMSVKHLEGWKTLCSCEGTIDVGTEGNFICPNVSCTMVWCREECFEADERHVYVCGGKFDGGKKLRSSRMYESDPPALLLLLFRAATSSGSKQQEKKSER
ncbi:hypothetical protein BD410DRAFT_837422 [Rickenella mellea]|uniref:Uncharacterized protein n=1 Tax=Rickenella mellea TaxID=50990 RepID=A0A4Y7QD51_9AGAM|nr:hypothetical protein BD410DRAFT_837422 [Rickenella mellea]